MGTEWTNNSKVIMKVYRIWPFVSFILYKALLPSASNMSFSYLAYILRRNFIFDTADAALTEMW
jgi:hypothetical protein